VFCPIVRPSLTSSKCLYRIAGTIDFYFSSRFYRRHVGNGAAWCLDVRRKLQVTSPSMGHIVSLTRISAVFCACLPSLKPIYNLVVGKPLNTTAHSAATSNTYSKSKSKASKGLWSTSNDSSKPESFTRLRDEEDWSNTSTTANKGTANVYLEPVELRNVDR
jgi:hypothetical protein